MKQRLRGAVTHSGRGVNIQFGVARRPPRSPVWRGSVIAMRGRRLGSALGWRGCSHNVRCGHCWEVRPAAHTARRVPFHRGSPEFDDLDTVKLAEPLCSVADPLHPLISEGRLSPL